MLKLNNVEELKLSCGHQKPKLSKNNIPSMSGEYEYTCPTGECHSETGFILKDGPLFI